MSRSFLKQKWVQRTIALLVIIILAIVIINVLVRLTARPYIHKDKTAVPHAQVALILGAGVYQSGVLMPVLKDRVDTAIALYRLGKVDKILISGDNAHRSYNEVSPVRLYLISEGVPEEDIFLDFAGFDTYDSMYRARDVFQATSVTVVTQNFHLPRAVFLARSLGLEAYGISADRRDYLFKNQVRELFANVKSFAELSFNLKPKFLGEKIPITGDGRESLPPH